MAIYVSNLPMIWPLMREWFPALKKFTPGQKSSSGVKNGESYGMTSKAGMSNGLSIPSRTFGGKSASDNMGGIITTIMGKRESLEEQSSGDEVELVGVRKGSWPVQRTLPGGDEWNDILAKGGIHKSTTVHVSEEHIDPQTDVQIPEQAFLNEADLERGIGGVGKKWDFGKNKESRRF